MRRSLPATPQMVEKDRLPAATDSALEGSHISGMAPRPRFLRLRPQCYYRARYYDPAPGRFISEDRARFGGGFDFYAYVKNDPIDFTDPTGLKCWQSSPWTEIPSMSSNGPSPYQVLQDGLDWVPAGFSYAGNGLVKGLCICKWIATHQRIRKFYSVTVKEQAQFKCDCPPSTYYETRDRTKNYEVDSPGNPIWPTQEATTVGGTMQLGGLAGAHPALPGNTVCTCPAPTP